MRWRVRHGDILDVAADVLVCSANPFLTLSGGVGGSNAVRAALRAAADCGARVVALTALATGYGRLSIGQFAQGLPDVIAEDFTPISEVIIGVRGSEDVLELSRVVPTVAVA
jgi:O-acetyl-ADP-ribose deacetylase (regulator of RNase III)